MWPPRWSLRVLRCPPGGLILLGAAQRWMGLAPTLVAARKAAGFTLLELLIVITIIAIASTGAAMALRDSAQSGLETEAQRLTALLELGRAQSRASGLPVRFVATPRGFVLNGTHQTWLMQGVQAAIETPLLLGPEPVIAPQGINLWLTEQPQFTLRVATDGIRPFSVTSLPIAGATP